MGIGIGSIIGIVAFLVVAPVLGCLLAGIDRKLTAGLQGRVGPKLLQPYYDFRKLLDKEDATVNGAQDLYVLLYLVFIVLSGVVFFAGGNFLLCVFILTLGSLFLIVAAYASRSPYAELGAQREIVQVMAYEPMVLFLCVGFYLATGSFNTSSVFYMNQPILFATWGFFIGLVFVLTIKLRKSPFDLSYSHHAHQELVKGITTEMSGKTLAKVEVMHWCENVLFLGWCGIFFVTGNWVSLIVAVLVCVVLYLFEIFIDNNFARVKWQVMLKSAWAVALVAGVINTLVLIML